VTRFETSVRIRRPIGEVFDLVADPLSLPGWNSAVRNVRTVQGPDGEVGSTYAMQRELPRGRARNDLEIVTRQHPAEFAIRTTSGPTPFAYRYLLSSAGGDTVIRLDGVFELDGVAGLLGPLAARAVSRGVEDNLKELKRQLEAPIPRVPKGRSHAT
jgi:uncharacterized protein YndB with AHSA1/START domain